MSTIRTLHKKTLATHSATKSLLVRIYYRRGNVVNTVVRRHRTWSIIMTAYTILWLSTLVFLGIGMLISIVFFRNTDRRNKKRRTLDSVLFR